VIYTPPVGQKLLVEKLQNWADFMHQSTTIDPLVRMAVQHYQFEAIHPFTDGNGRTGRIMNILFLQQQGLLNSPILYLSRHIIQNKGEYYRQHTSQYMQKQLPKTYSWELVEVLFKQPYCRINNLVAARVAKRQTASLPETAV